MNPVDISTETNALCAKLKLEPRLVKQMTITHRTLNVDVYDTTDTGTKYLDTETNTVATSTITFEVTT